MWPFIILLILLAIVIAIPLIIFITPYKNKSKFVIHHEKHLNRYYITYGEYFLSRGLSSEIDTRLYKSRATYLNSVEEAENFIEEFKKQQEVISTPYTENK